MLVVRYVLSKDDVILVIVIIVVNGQNADKV